MNDSKSCETAPSGIAFEQHFSIQQIAETWGLSADKTREIFQNEQGVVIIGEPERRFKRSYITLRVPESVVRRVHARLTRREFSTVTRRAA